LRKIKQDENTHHLKNKSAALQRIGPKTKVFSQNDTKSSMEGNLNDTKSRIEGNLN
jgi:hypothetical protein